jgi:hypothetical protein
MMKRITILFIALSSSILSVVAQSENVTRVEPLLLRDTTSYSFPSLGLTPNEFKKSKGSVQVNGFYRFFATYTRQMMPYTLTAAPGDTVLPRSLFIGDDAQLPNLLLNVSGQMPGGSSWGFDVRMFQFLNGSISPSYGRQVPDSLRPDIQYPLGSVPLGGNLGAMLGMNLYGNFKTQYGTWSTTVGGIQWLAISDLTFASWKGYNRFMLFERNPWDPMGTTVANRYKQYYDQGSIDQDARWGNRAFQGVVVNGSQLPGNLSCTLMAGKTEQNGGFSQVPNYAYGGRIKKNFKGNSFLSINSISTRNFTDSLAQEQFGLNVITTEFQYEQFGFLLKGELGMGDYFSPDHNEGWGEVMQLKASNVMKGDKPVVELHYFRISPKVVNNNGVYWNTSVREYTVNDIPAGSVGSSSLLLPFGSSVTRVGQMTNNRQGLNLNVQAKVQRLKISAGIGASAEINPAAAIITVGHPVNQFTRSRFWRWNFPANIGPYGRYSDVYRDVYETIRLSDDSAGVVVNKKFFNAAEVQLKYEHDIAGHESYFFALLQANTCSRDLSALPVINEEAYVRQYASEIEWYFRITPKFMFNAYAGIERTLGNYLTEISEETFRPLNQFGKGFGIGGDIDLGKNTRLYLRHRWYSFEDTSFPLDAFKGRELVVELKAFF